MKKRYLAGMLAGAGASYFVGRTVLKSMLELQRYDRSRAMSNEGPVLEEAPEMLMQVLAQERQFASDALSFFRSLPKDIVRYVKMETM